MSDDRDWPKRIWRFSAVHISGSLMWGIFMTAVLITGMWSPVFWSNLKRFEDISPWVAVKAFLALTVVASSIVACFRLHSVMEWSLMHLLGHRKGTNINVAPVQLPILGPFYLILLAVSLPGVVTVEEYVFRDNLQGWRQAIVFSFLFGLAHLFVGVPVGAVPGLTLAGLWFSYEYFKHGIDGAIAAHLAYDSIALVILALCLLAGRLESDDEADEEEAV